MRSVKGEFRSPLKVMVRMLSSWMMPILGGCEEENESYGLGEVLSL